MRLSLTQKKNEFWPFCKFTRVEWIAFTRKLKKLQDKRAKEKEMYRGALLLPAWYLSNSVIVDPQIIVWYQNSHIQTNSHQRWINYERGGGNVASAPGQPPTTYTCWRREFRLPSVPRTSRRPDLWPRDRSANCCPGNLFSCLFALPRPGTSLGNV